MKSEWKHRYFPAAIAGIAIAASLRTGPEVRADEPDEPCWTHYLWAQEAGIQTVAGAGACPTFGACDTPSVRDAWIPGPSTPMLTIRVKVNVFCHDDGSDCVVSPSDVADQMAKLNADFAPHRIQFTEQSEYIHASVYRDMYYSDYAAMTTAYADDPARQMNVYVVNLSPPELLGFTEYPWAPRVLDKQGGIGMAATAFGAGKTTLSHEVGHILGLYHTFRGVTEVGDDCLEACYERADGVNADVTGDLASDTPPTPAWNWCSDPPDNDPCSDPPRPWAPTQPENLMGYGPQECRTLFTPRQAGRMHCWVHDRLMSWVSCTTDAECEDGDNCTPDLCVDGVCQPCGCHDSGGSSPLVCLRWHGADPPELNEDFAIDMATDPANPNVELVTGNDGWTVWSQVSATDYTPANLGHVTINPALSSENYALTLAHGGLPGAAGLASLALVREGWSGRSRLSGGRITGDLTGELIVQESGGEGGDASFTIDGDVHGNVTIPKLDELVVKGAVADNAAITIGGFVGQKRARFNVEGGAFAGELILSSGLPSDASVRLLGGVATGASIDLNQQELAGSFMVFGTFTGSLCAANLSGTKPVPPNVVILSIASGAEVCGVGASQCATTAAAPAVESGGVTKNRFISLVPGTNSGRTAIAVNLDSLHHPPTPPNAPDFTQTEEQVRYVKPFRNLQNEPVFTCPDFSTSYACARLVIEPEYVDWASQIGSSTVLHVTGAEIAPSSRYNVHMIVEGCELNWAAYSRGIVVETALWGDVNNDDGVNVLDLASAVDKIKDRENALPEDRTLLRFRCLWPVYQSPNVIDVARLVEAVKDFPYPFNVETCLP